MIISHADAETLFHFLVKVNSGSYREASFGAAPPFAGCLFESIPEVGEEFLWNEVDVYIKWDKASEITGFSDELFLALNELTLLVGLEEIPYTDYLIDRLEPKSLEELL